MISIDQIAGQLDKVHRTKNGYMACCPAHEDRSQSLSITEADGRILMHCFAGCGIDEITQALGISVIDLFPDASRDRHQQVPEFKRRQYEELLTHERLVKMMVDQLHTTNTKPTEADKARAELAVTRIKKLEALLDE